MKKLKLFKNNKGSGLVSSLIAMMFIISLAATMSILAYTAYRMAITERTGREVNIKLSSAADEIQAGLQEMISDCITDAYDETMIHYTEYGMTFSDIFRQACIDNAKEWKFNGYGAASTGAYPQALFTETAFNLTGDDYSYKVFQYNLDAIRGMVENLDDITITYDADRKLLTDPDNKDFAIDNAAFFDNGNKKIIIKNVRITVNDGGFTSGATTDFVIEIPDLSYKFNRNTVTGIPNYAAIVKGTLKAEIQTNTSSQTVQGGAYAGKLQVGAGKRFILQAGNDTVSSYLICPRGVEIEGDNAQFMLRQGAQLWTDNILCRAASQNGQYNVDIAGDAYVKNDLALKRAKAKVRLSGSYYGLGNGYSGVEGDTTENPSESSSIIVNSLNCTLNMQDITALQLAGFSFVGSGDGAVRMSESVSVKIMQQIYFCPLNLIQKQRKSGGEITEVDFATNPYICQTEAQYSEYNNFEYSLEANPIMKKRVEYQDPNNPNSVIIDEREMDLRPYHPSLKIYDDVKSGKHVIYFFLQFGNDSDSRREKYELANRFFRDYCSKFPEEIDRYIDSYVSTFNKPALINGEGEAIPFTMAGDAWFLNSSESASHVNPEMFIESSTLDIYRQQFENLSVTLNDSDSNRQDINGVAVNNPYDYIVNSELFSNSKYFPGDNTVCEFTDKDDDSRVVAIAVKVTDPSHPFVIDNNSEYKGVSIIICNGDVEIQSAFRGLVICAGNLTISANGQLTSSSSDVIEAYFGRYPFSDSPNGYVNIGTFFKKQISEAVDQPGIDYDGQQWDTGGLISCDNWIYVD